MFVPVPCLLSPSYAAILLFCQDFSLFAHRHLFPHFYRLLMSFFWTCSLQTPCVSIISPLEAFNPTLLFSISGLCELKSFNVIRFALAPVSSFMCSLVPFTVRGTNYLSASLLVLPALRCFHFPQWPQKLHHPHHLTHCQRPSCWSLDCFLFPPPEKDIFAKWFLPLHFEQFLSEIRTLPNAMLPTTEAAVRDIISPGSTSSTFSFRTMGASPDYSIYTCRRSLGRNRSLLLKCPHLSFCLFTSSANSNYIIKF